MIPPERIRHLNKNSPKNRKYVLYWMQTAHRAQCNHALEYAVREANALRKPLVVSFGLTGDFPEANARHYTFMLEGLQEVRRTLEGRGIRMTTQNGAPDEGAVRLSRNACSVIVDRGYTRHLRGWREKAAGAMDCPLVQVETDAVVPVEEVSPKEEYAARTIRPKIHKKLQDYLKPLKETPLRKDSLGLRFRSFDIGDIGRALRRLRVDAGVPPVSAYRGGSSHAMKRLDEFLKKKLKNYGADRNDPNLDGVSGMSPYLHYGQISPLQIAMRLRRRKGTGADAFLEELIVRRELSLNFVTYNPDYDRFAGIPEWCRKTLAKHEKDRRDHVYRLPEFESAETHDPYWNAAQREMTLTGKMHGYMRMYWGKKIIEWSETPEEAYRIALHLNNKYELDGRDPNGYAGVAWCFGKHDRPWSERSIFGTVRYMNAGGLRRKFDADAYVKKVNALPQDCPPPLALRPNE